MITTEESCINSYWVEIHESEQVHISTKLLSVILYNKYEKSDWNKVMEN